MNQLLDNFIQWAKAQEDIRLVCMVGSRGRDAIDEYSDYDLECFTTDIEKYRGSSGDFAHQFGTVWVNKPFLRGDGWPEFLVLYEDAIKMDFSFIDLGVRATHMQHNLYRRGYKLLLDKDGLTLQLPPNSSVLPAPEKPTVAQFKSEVEAFYYGAVYVAKQIRRRQLWTVQYRDWTMKGSLLAILEWYAQFILGESDTWYEGRSIHEWANEEILLALRDAFPHYEVADSWRALQNTMQLFSRLAPEIANTFDYDYPLLLEAKVMQYVESLYEEDKF